MTNARTLSIKNPATGQDLVVRFEYDFLNYLHKFQPVRWENLRTVEWVLKNPTRLFIGIKRAVSNEGLCFVGKPDQWYIHEEAKVSFPKEKLVFAVFLNDRNSVYDYRAEKIDLEDPESPMNWKDRFGGVLWKKIS